MLDTVNSIVETRVYQETHKRKEHIVLFDEKKLPYHFKIDVAFVMGVDSMCHIQRLLVNRGPCITMMTKLIKV